MSERGGMASCLCLLVCFRVEPQSQSPITRSIRVNVSAHWANRAFPSDPHAANAFFSTAKQKRRAPWRGSNSLKEEREREREREIPCTIALAKERERERERMLAVHTPQQSKERGSNVVEGKKGEKN